MGIPSDGGSCTSHPVAKTGYVETQAEWLMPLDQDAEEEQAAAEQAADADPVGDPAAEQAAEPAEQVEHEVAHPPQDGGWRKKPRKTKVVDMKEHCRYGHQEFVPYCHGCAQGAAKKRSHWRLDPDTRPGGTLALDLSGPHVFGRGFGVPTATGYRYFLCGVYQPPAGGYGKAKAPMALYAMAEDESQDQRSCEQRR